MAYLAHYAFLAWFVWLHDSFISFTYLFLFLLFLSITFIYLAIYYFLFICLLSCYLFIYLLLLFYHSLIYLSIFIHLFNLIIWCLIFIRKSTNRGKKKIEIGKTFKREGTLLSVSEDHRRVKIGMKKFLEKIRLLTWYAWIDFLKFKKDFSGGWDIGFEERKTSQVERLSIAIKRHRLVVLMGKEKKNERFSKKGLWAHIEGEREFIWVIGVQSKRRGTRWSLEKQRRTLRYVYCEPCIFSFWILPYLILC